MKEKFMKGLVAILVMSLVLTQAGLMGLPSIGYAEALGYTVPDENLDGGAQRLKPVIWNLTQDGSSVVNDNIDIEKPFKLELNFKVPVKGDAVSEYISLPAEGTQPVTANITLFKDVNIAGIDNWKNLPIESLDGKLVGLPA